MHRRSPIRARFGHGKGNNYFRIGLVLAILKVIVDFGIRGMDYLGANGNLAPHQLGSGSHPRTCPEVLSASPAFE